jgi:hypothetical protein
MVHAFTSLDGPRERRRKEGPCTGRAPSARTTSWILAGQPCSMETAELGLCPGIASTPNHKYQVGILCNTSIHAAPGRDRHGLGLGSQPASQPAVVCAFVTSTWLQVISWSRVDGWKFAAPLTQVVVFKTGSKPWRCTVRNQGRLEFRRRTASCLWPLQPAPADPCLCGKLYPSHPRGENQPIGKEYLASGRLQVFFFFFALH